MNKVNPISNHQTTRMFPEATDADIDAANAYENIFVPALFQYWPAHVTSAAGVRAGDRTLDIACGTGVLTRQLLAITSDSPAPLGLDISPGMLEVANQISPQIRWHQGDAVALPFEDDSFDKVLCQFGMMFFPDRVRALREMSRVLAPGGCIALAVWDSVENNPGFSEKIDILDQLAGHSAGDALRAPFCLGDKELLRQIAKDAGFGEVEINAIEGEARFRNMRDFVDAEVHGWLPVMGVHLDNDVIEAIHSECQQRLAGYENQPGGELVLPMSAHVATLGSGIAH